MGLKTPLHPEGQGGENGKRGGLKTRSPQGVTGSSPVPGTSPDESKKRNSGLERGTDPRQLGLFEIIDQGLVPAIQSRVPYLFNGPEYVPERDNARLGAQLKRIRDLMLDGCWRTLHAIELATGDPPASISAQLRHLRKHRHGTYVVNRRHLGGGLYEYQVQPPVHP